MTVRELAMRLKEMYENSSNEKTTMIHLFGIMYAEEIKGCGSTPKEILKLANMPEQMIQNIAKGRLAKFFKDNCLVDQEFQFGDGDKQTVAEYLKKQDAELKIVAYKRFTLVAE